MKTLFPTLIFLVCLSTGCTKDLSFPDPTAPVGMLLLLKTSTSTPPADFNGFTVNGTLFDARYMGKTHATRQQFWFQSDQDEGATFTCNTKDPLPTSDGVYTFMLSDDLTQPGNMQIACVLNSARQQFELYAPSGQTAIVKVVGENISLLIPDVQLESMDGPINSITVSAELSLSQLREPVRTTKPDIITQ